MIEMTKIVRTISSLVYPLTIVFGAFMIMHGHLTPGGGFQGGAIIASGIALVIVAYGSEASKDWFSHKRLAQYTGIGSMGFAVIGLIAIALGYAFLHNYLLGTPLFGYVPNGINQGFINSAGIEPPIEIMVGIAVSGGLGLIVYMFSQLGGVEE